MNRNIADHYRKLFLQYGDSAEAAQYSSRASQERRFDILSRVADLDGSSVLDFGCGAGHLATYLAGRGWQVRYTGVDLVDELLDEGRRKHPQHRFCKLTDLAGARFDFAIVSGVFNNRFRGNRKFYRDTVRQLFALCDRGVAFNMMSYYVDYYDPALFYEKPQEVLRFVKQEISPYVLVRNDYQVKPGVLPFEFTVYVYREPVP